MRPGVAHAGLLHLRKLKRFLDSEFAIGRLRHVPLPAVAALREENIACLVHLRVSLAAGAGPGAGVTRELLRRFMSDRPVAHPRVALRRLGDPPRVDRPLLQLGRLLRLPSHHEAVHFLLIWRSNHHRRSLALQT